MKDLTVWDWRSSPCLWATISDDGVLADPEDWRITSTAEAFDAALRQISPRPRIMARRWPDGSFWVGQQWEHYDEPRLRLIWAALEAANG